MRRSKYKADELTTALVMLPIFVSHMLVDKANLLVYGINFSLASYLLGEREWAETKKSLCEVMKEVFQ